MSNFFTEKYGGSTGRILDTWGQDQLNKEIGEIYEKKVFSQESIDMEALLNEYHGRATGGRVGYSSDIKTAPKGGVLEG